MTRSYSVDNDDDDDLDLTCLLPMQELKCCRLMVDDRLDGGSIIVSCYDDFGSCLDGSWCGLG